MRMGGNRLLLAMAGAFFLFAAMPVLALRPDGDVSDRNQGDKAAALTVVKPSEAKLRAVAGVPGLKVSWDSRNGRPSSVVLRDVAATSAALAVKGLKVSGKGDFRSDAVAVLDSVGCLYDVRDAEREFEVRSTDRDSHGFHHVRVEQRHQGLPVVGGDMLVHFDPAGKAFAVNGSYEPGLAVSTVPSLTPDQALALAQADLRGLGKPEGVLAGSLRLVIFARGKVPALAYEFTLTYDDAGAAPGRWRYWVDAVNGAILSRYNNIQTVDVTGRLLTGEGGATVTIQATSFGGGINRLDNDTRGWLIYNYGEGRTGEMYTDAIDAHTVAFRTSTDWTIPAPNFEDRAEVSAAHNFDGIQEYYRIVHGRDSFDDSGTKAYTRVHAGIDYVNAFWDPNATNFTFGDGDAVNANCLAVLDVAGHEFQHGVTEYSAGLIYQDESGALNESFSDIFGTLIEFYMQPDSRTGYPLVEPGMADWLMGEDCWLSSKALRDLRNPKNVQTVGTGGRQPTFYLGEYWYSGYGDNGGVHQNASVQSYMFYLLCEGGEGVNESRNFYVPKIGITNGGELAYLALTEYMTPDTDYTLAREAWMLAALQMDQEHSYLTHFYVSVEAAWSAVGIGSPDLIEPYEDYHTAGEVGTMSFNPSNKIYTVFNPYSVAHTWMVTSSLPWIVISPASVTIPALSYTNLIVSLGPAVTALPEGLHTNGIGFVNVTRSDRTTARTVVLLAVRNYRCVSTPYEWVDFEGMETAGNLALKDDGVSDVLSIPFPVNYYLNTFTNFYVSANGMLGFVEPGLGAYQNVVIPTPAPPNGMLCPLWDDLNPVRSTRGIRWGVTGTEEQTNRRLVVSWMDIAHVEDWDALYSFQIVIPENGTNKSDILYQYQEVSPRREAHGNGMTATVGVEDPWFGLIGKMYSFNGSSWVANSQALLFTPYPPADHTAPTGTISVWNWTTSSVTFEVRFHEIVTDFTAGDLTLGTGPNTAPGAVISSLRGGGERYLVDVTGITGLGTVSIGLPANRVFDLGTNGNVAIPSFLFVMPTLYTAFEDNMEDGPGTWQITTQNQENVRSDAWEYGVPTYSNGPPSAHSGSQCWGTDLDGLCNGSPTTITKSWLTSTPIAVGENPVLQFAIWFNFTADVRPIYGPTDVYWYSNSYVRVDVDNGYGWRTIKEWPCPIDPYGNPLWTNSGGWQVNQVWLGDEEFGNRLIRVRVGVVGIEGPGAYFDDIYVGSRENPGLWPVAVTTIPSPLVPNTSASMGVRLYNSNTSTYSAVTGSIHTVSQGVTMGSVTSLVYGALAPGQQVWSSNPARFSLGSASALGGPRITLVHDALARGLAVSSDELVIPVGGTVLGLGTNLIYVACYEGVKDWMDRFLSGNGNDGSAIFQLIAAGPDGVANPPMPSGMPTGDDRFLYGQDDRALGYFGEGAGVPDDLGQFGKLFRHNLSLGDKVYVRAWDIGSFASSVAYGDSPLCTITNLENQMKVFPRWLVNRVVNSANDSNGDSIPDQWCIDNGLDPRIVVGGGLTPGWSVTDAVGSFGTAPGQFNQPARVVCNGSFIFVLDTLNSRIQVFNRGDMSLLRTFGTGGTNDCQFNAPGGLALDPRPGTNRLAVADSGNNRVQVFSFNAATAEMALLWKAGVPGPAGLGSGIGQFANPQGVAMGYGGNVYVADTGDGVHSGNCRIKVYNGSGSYVRSFGSYGSSSGLLKWPKGVCIGTNETVIVADTDNHRLQAFTETGAFLWAAGTNGTGNLQFNRPRGVRVDSHGRIYVADTDNSRIQVLNASRNHLVSLGTQGSGAGELSHPYDACLDPMTNILYVADTANSRVQAFSMILDADRDGMNDYWEDQNGLNSANPADALWDLDGDGLSNLAEYRASSNPRVIDSNGDGQSDGAEVGFPRDPFGVALPADHVALIRALSGQVIVMWRATTGVQYAVEVSTNIVNTSGWTRPDGFVTATFDGTFVWLDLGSFVRGPRYYRVVRLVP